MNGVQKAQTATKVLFGQDLSSLSGNQIIEAFKDDTYRFTQLDRSSLVGIGLDQLAAITNAAKSRCKWSRVNRQSIKLLSSTADAQKKMKAGGFYLNNVRVNNHKQMLEEKDLIDGKVCVLRVGKSSYYLIQAI